MAISPRMRRLAEVALSSDSPGIMSATPPDVEWYETDGMVLMSSIVSLVTEYAAVSGMRETDVLREITKIIYDE